jgi:hypothetical protein
MRSKTVVLERREQAHNTMRHGGRRYCQPMMLRDGVLRHTVHAPSHTLEPALGYQPSQNLRVDPCFDQLARRYALATSGELDCAVTIGGGRHVVNSRLF